MENRQFYSIFWQVCGVAFLVSGILQIVFNEELRLIFLSWIIIAVLIFFSAILAGIISHPRCVWPGNFHTKRDIYLFCWYIFVCVCGIILIVTIGYCWKTSERISQYAWLFYEEGGLVLISAIFLILFDTHNCSSMGRSLSILVLMLIVIQLLFIAAVLDNSLRSTDERLVITGSFGVSIGFFGILYAVLSGAFLPKDKEYHCACDSCRGAELGISLSYLKRFLERPDVTPGMKTYEVVDQIIKPQTNKWECRWADLKSVREESGAVGKATVFASHCWGAEFATLVSALSLVLRDSDYVFVDIFAVNQHPGEEQNGDIDFVPVVQSCGVLILCSQHLETVAKLTRDQAKAQQLDLVPFEERRRCSFYRVWCLVELAAALANKIPVVMLVGDINEKGEYHTNKSMLYNMHRLVDAGKAEASFPKDITLVLDEIIPKVLKLSTREEVVSRINSLARGAIGGAFHCMELPALLQAVLGDSTNLLLLPKKDQIVHMVKSAAAGFWDPIDVLLESTHLDVNVEDTWSEYSGRMLSKVNGHATPLRLASFYGHAHIVKNLILRGADLEKDKGLSLLFAQDKKNVDVENLITANTLNMKAIEQKK